jgi:two-component system response regulator AtoC
VKGLKVLIVDDEPLMRLSMLDALEGIGCEVMAAATGTEGLTILGTRQFDIVITDLRLPGADGLTILKACKERSPTTEVILITAHGSVGYGGSVRSSWGHTTTSPSRFKWTSCC